MTALAPTLYLCPGETAPIGRAVHLARLAAGFAACRGCPLREGPLPPGPASGDGGASRPLLKSLMTADGIRGVWRNEIGPAEAARVAAALAALLAEEATARPPAGGVPVVVGYDGRPWSAALAAAAGSELRRRGCETIDVGPATGPAFRFAVDHLDAAAGLLATGAGGGPAAAGFDVALDGGRPLSRGGGLDRLADLADRPLGRPTRRGGGRRAFDAATPYDASLRKHLRGFAPAIAVVGSASRLVRERLERLAPDLAVGLKVVPLPSRDFGTPAADDPLAAAVRQATADFGVRIDEEGAALRLFDETGRPRTAFETAELLLADLLAERPGATLSLDWPLAERLGEALGRRGGDVARGGGTAESMFGSVRDHRSAAGADAAGRLWLPGPTADALAALPRLLRLVGDSGRPLSATLAEQAER